VGCNLPVLPSRYIGPKAILIGHRVTTRFDRTGPAHAADFEADRTMSYAAAQAAETGECLQATFVSPNLEWPVQPLFRLN
jgi:hypothetical protein